ncbi:MAG TPA: transketolase, partial [Syntrophorhabdaceae bacterium]|nr:transketolase [Syntrophorhabdaceae bacterium]
MKNDRINRIYITANKLRVNVLEMMGIGKPGHLGGSLSLAEIVSALYFDFMHFDPANIKDPDRDRFILSKGHAVLIQYAALVELGVIPRSELAKTKSLEGILQGHPDMGQTPGIEAVTGSLGQGLSIGVGMALAARLDNRKYRVFVVMGDGEISEGQIWEAAMAASTFKLGNLTGILDRNGIQSTGRTNEVFAIPELEDKWRSFGWNVITIDGHDVEQILKAFGAAQQMEEKPTVIIADTVKGKGISYAENSAAFHNAALTEEQMKKALAELKTEGEIY